MNILLVVTGLPDAKSPARSVFNLRYATELSKLGNKVTILYLRAVKPGSSFFKKTIIKGLECYEIRNTIPKVGLLKNTYFHQSLFKIILNSKSLSQEFNKIDLIHAIGGNSLEAAYLISKRYKPPLISQFIGSDLNKDFAKLLKNKNFIKGVQKSKYLCFNSKGLEKVFLSKIKNKSNTRILYRGVKLNEFNYNFTKPSVINILFLGGFPRNTNLKGGFTLIDAIRLLDSNSLSKPVKFTIGGPNSKNFLSNLDNLQNDNISIDFIGAIDRGSVLKKMHESHIIIIPSENEGLPNILYEAMATGNMVIATDVGGISEILENELTGKLIPPNDHKALMLDIMFAINNINNIEKYAKNGREKIKNYSYEKFIKGYLKLYDESVKNSRNINFKEQENSKRKS